MNQETTPVLDKPVEETVTQEISEEDLLKVQQTLLEELNLKKAQAFDLLRTKDQVTATYKQITDQIVAIEQEYVKINSQLNPIEPVQEEPEEQPEG